MLCNCRFFSILSFSLDYKAVKVMNKELLHFLKEINGNTYIGNDIAMKQMAFQANIKKLDNMKRKLAASLQHANISLRLVSMHYAHVWLTSYL